MTTIETRATSTIPWSRTSSAWPSTSRNACLIEQTIAAEMPLGGSESSTNVIVCSTTHLRAMRRAPPRCGPATSTLDIALRSLLDAGDGDRFAAGRRVPSLIGA
jgi:hypothetical protein